MLVGGLALFLGGEMVVSVTGVVLAFRFGNPLPLFLLASCSLLLIRVSASVNPVSPSHGIMNVIAWASVACFTFAVIIIVIPFGIHIALLSGALVVIGCRLIQEPSGVMDFVSQFSSLLNHTSDVIATAINFENGAELLPSIPSFPFDNMKALILPKALTDSVVQVMRERPILPVSLVYLLDFDLLAINVADDSTWVQKVESVLEEARITGYRRASAQLASIVLSLPFVEQAHGIPLDEYRVVSDNEVVDKLLRIRPERMTLFPSLQGLIAILPVTSVPGLPAEVMTRRFLKKLFLSRDPSILRMGVESAGDAT
ncbi:MAG: hypothetical protein JSW61_00440 [Candidatus Thorarchaeota archaeon]|nr:MAG: hypothetical protein JSW61_00440 [Candidatus Thorarchaeota archaeon]